MNREERLKQYIRDYDITGLNNSNDQATLEMLVTLEENIELMNNQLRQMVQEGAVDRIMDIKKLHDVLRDSMRTYQDLQTTLGIDRRSRRGDGQQNVHSYIEALLGEAKAFAMTRLRYVYCPTCKVLLGRFAPAHDHTAYTVSFQCSQCGAFHTESRDSSDPMDDLPLEEKAWRKAYSYTITQSDTPSQHYQMSLEVDHSGADSTVIDISTLSISSFPQVSLNGIDDLNTADTKTPPLSSQIIDQNEEG